MAGISSPTQRLLSQLQAYLRTLYGERLYQLVLFGSHARGEARPDSDMDVLVVLKGAVNSGQEVARISEYLAHLSLEYDQVVSCLFMDETRYTTRQGPLLRNIRREGLVV